MRLLSSRTTEVEGPIWFSSFATNGKRQSMRITWLLWCGWRNVSGTPRGSSGYLTEYLCKSYFGTNPIPFPSLNWAVLLSQILSRVQLSATGFSWEPPGFVTEKWGPRHINSCNMIGQTSVLSLYTGKKIITFFLRSESHCWKDFLIYPLVNVYTTMENHHFNNNR
jgi:hypothetical protein